jgi:hypothetical protein
MKVSKDQFLMKGERLIHEPTSAVLQKVELEPKWIARGNAGHPLPTGDCYDEEEILKVARELLLAVRREGLG